MSIFALGIVEGIIIHGDELKKYHPETWAWLRDKIGGDPPTLEELKHQRGVWKEMVDLYKIPNLKDPALPDMERRLAQMDRMILELERAKQGVSAKPPAVSASPAGPARPAGSLPEAPAATPSQAVQPPVSPDSTQAQPATPGAKPDGPEPDPIQAMEDPGPTPTPPEASPKSDPAKTEASLQTSPKPSPGDTKATGSDPGPRSLAMETPFASQAALAATPRETEPSPEPWRASWDNPFPETMHESFYEDLLPKPPKNGLAEEPEPFHGSPALDPWHGWRPEAFEASDESNPQGRQDVVEE